MKAGFGVKIAAVLGFYAVYRGHAALPARPNAVQSTETIASRSYAEGYVPLLPPSLPQYEAPSPAPGNNVPGTFPFSGTEATHRIEKRRPGKLAAIRNAPANLQKVLATLRQTVNTWKKNRADRKAARPQPPLDMVEAAKFRKAFIDSIPPPPKTPRREPETPREKVVWHSIKTQQKEYHEELKRLSKLPPNEKRKLIKYFERRFSRIDPGV